MSFDLALWEERLRATLDDGRASRGERRALRELMEEESPSPDERAQLRALLFALARQEQPRGDLIDWIEDVLRALEPLDGTVVGPNVIAFSPGDEPRHELIERIDKARKSIDVAIFTITDDRITRSLTRAAERGLRIRVLGDDAKAHDLGSDIFQLVNHPDIAVAQDNEGHKHHKLAKIDGSVLATGSINRAR